jgi:hypothetical protein
LQWAGFKENDFAVISEKFLIGKEKEYSRKQRHPAGRRRPTAPGIEIEFAAAIIAGDCFRAGRPTVSAALQNDDYFYLLSSE